MKHQIVLPLQPDDFFHLPERCSPLFHIPPYESDGPLRESLTSLIVRIARAHSVDPRKMLRNAISLHVPQIREVCTGGKFQTAMAGINGYNRYAPLFSKAIGDLAVIENLEAHTLLPLKHLVGPKYAVNHQKHRWCAQCLRDMVGANIEPYIPLIWTIAAVDVCHLHKCYLIDHCPHCKRVQPIIPRWPDIAYCDHCRGSLLTGEPTVVGTDDKYVLWRAIACADLMEFLHVIDSSMTGSFQRFMRSSIDSICQGNQSDFCRRLNLPTNSTNKWLAGEDKPTFSSLLKILFTFDILPSKVFLPGNQKIQKAAVINRLPRSRRKIQLEFPTDNRAAALESAIASNTPPTLLELATAIGISASHLRWCHPELCAMLQARRTEYMRTIRAQKRQSERNIVTETVHSLSSIGITPTRANVEIELNRHGYTLRSSTNIRNSYQIAVAELINRYPS